jgi:hypothetical protein
MIVEPHKPAVMLKITITPIGTPMQSSDRFLVTIADVINGKSSQQQASRNLVSL